MVNISTSYIMMCTSALLYKIFCMGMYDHRIASAKFRLNLRANKNQTKNREPTREPGENW